MSATNWSAFDDPLMVSKRAAGRRRYNKRRQCAAHWRQWKCSQLLEEVGYPLRWGWQSELARRVGVSRATICRDFKLVDEAFRRGTSVETEEYYRRVRATFERQERRALDRAFEGASESPTEALFRHLRTECHRVEPVG